MRGWRHDSSRVGGARGGPGESEDDGVHCSGEDDVSYEKSPAQALFPAYPPPLDPLHLPSSFVFSLLLFALHNGANIYFLHQ